MSMYFYDDPDKAEDEVSSGNPEETGESGEAGNTSQPPAKKENATSEQLKKKAKEKIEKEATKNASKMALKGALSHIMMYVVAFLVCFIIFVGIIMFLVTMPGMVMEKLKAIFKAVGNYVAAFFGADTTEQIDDTEIFETLDYLEDMGYDIKGEGFLSDYETAESLEELKNEFPDKDFYLDKKTGVIRNSDDDSIAEAESDFIFTYIMSDNYVYTIKNDNLVRQSPSEDGFWNKVKNVLEGIAIAKYKIARFFTAGTYWDALGVQNAAVSNWGKGMLVFYKEDGGIIGDRGSVKETGVTLFDWDTIKIDTESKTLSIKRKSLLNNNNAMEFSLDGWTGRYGMPLEFLLSVHKATGMPDLAVDMVNSFATEIEIILHKTSGEAVAAYKGTKGYIPFSELNKALTGMEGRNIFSKVLSWFDNLSQSDKEVRIATALGVDHDPNCQCTTEEVEGYTIGDGGPVAYKDSDGNYYKIGADGTTHVALTDDEKGKIVTTTEIQYTEIKQPCNGYLGKVISHIRDNNDYKYDAYTPYISKVTDHWYRDVYFVVNNDVKSDLSNQGKNFVQYDYDYEALMKERWTLYETYTNNSTDGYKYNPDKVGEFIYFIIDEDGNYKKENGEYVLFEGTVEDARPSVLYEKKTVNGETEYKEYTGKREGAESKNLYKLNSDGEYVSYTGDVAIGKKAVAFELTKENLEDLGWNNKQKSDIWTAYERQDTTSGYEPLYTQEEIDEQSDESIKQIMEKCYINLNMNGNIVQTGEGLRTETNSEIKKMFLHNNYFKYDGSADTAEIITELRNKLYEQRKSDSDSTNDYQYGPISDEERETFKITRKEKNNEGVEENVTYYAKDYSGNVMLNQDSLNAFSMLENTHTLDADYIYRDFKELIVELGYFEKEELADARPRLLQFPIPEIGSGGYPERAIDKRENEFGTMIHSKYDIEANEKNTMMYMVKEFLKAKGEGDAEGKSIQNDPDGYGLTTTNNSDAILANAWRDYTNIDSIKLGAVGAINAQGALDKSYKDQNKEGSYESSVSGISVDEFLAKAREICEYMDDKGYDYCVTNGTGCTHKGYATCGSLSATFEDSKSNRNVCCATLVSWVLRDVGVDMSGCGNQNYCPVLVPYLAYQLGGEVITEYADLEPGDILCYIHNADDGDSLGHVDILGEKEGDGYLKYNGGHYADKSNSSIGTFNQSSFNSEYLCFGIRLFGSKSSGEPYEGFLGNEAVVSPVTGILLEYGTYTEDMINSTTNEEYRLNVDVKYGTNLDAVKNDDETLGDNDNNDDDDNETSKDSRVVYDKVGYARILVLDKENYEKLETYTNTKWKSYNSSDGLLTKNGVYLDEIDNEDELKELMDEEKKAGRSPELMESVYGFKTFAEAYETGEISGYEIYIDGFKTELPDEDFTISDDGTPSKERPEGTALTIDSFKIDPSKITEENDNIQTLYEPDEEYKVASQKATDKINTEYLIKTETTPALYVDETIFIKEGTVIGRTYTNEEIVEDLRNEKMEDYEADTSTVTGIGSDDEEEVDQNKLIGNYLNIIMTNTDLHPVENVENYMKLDDVGSMTGIYADLEAIDENSSDAEKVRAIMSYFIEQGFSVEAAAGICGNLICESNLDPKIVSASGYTGLAQWSSSWWPQQVNWMSTQGYNEDSFAGQVRSIYEAPNTGSISVGGGYDVLKKITNIDQATEFFMVYYEGCIGSSGDGFSDPTEYYAKGKYYQGSDDRKKFAQNAYDIYMGDNNKGIKDK